MKAKFKGTTNYSMSKKLDEIIEKALANIEADRLVTRDLLEDAIEYLAKDEHRHKEIGLTLAKYVEPLQRSNEQMVKVATLIQKEEKKEDQISREEMENLFSAIAEEKDGNLDHIFASSRFYCKSNYAKRNVERLVSRSFGGIVQ